MFRTLKLILITIITISLTGCIKDKDGNPVMEVSCDESIEVISIHGTPDHTQSLGCNYLIANFELEDEPAGVELPSTTFDDLMIRSTVGIGVYTFYLIASDFGSDSEIRVPVTLHVRSN